MKNLLILILLCFFIPVSGQEKYKKVLTGKIALPVFTKDKELKIWYNKTYQAYLASDSLLTLLKPRLNEMNIVVILGTWCSDSQREFPRLMKILDLINFPRGQLKVYGTDKKKSKVPKIIQQYGITHLPTIIVVGKDRLEKGRIIEQVKTSLEADLYSFLK